MLRSKRVPAIVFDRAVRHTAIQPDNIEPIRRVMVDGALVTEIAAELGVTTGAISRRIQRVHEAIKERGLLDEDGNVVNVSPAAPGAPAEQTLPIGFTELRVVVPNDLAFEIHKLIQERMGAKQPE